MDYNETFEFSTGLILFWIALVIFYLYVSWKIFEKAGRPGWEAIIPLYSAYILLKIVGKPGWWLLLYLIPFVILYLPYGPSTCFQKALVRMKVLQLD
jgi:hypothetical protein